MSPLPPRFPPSVAQCLWSAALNPATVLLAGAFFNLEDQDREGSQSPGWRHPHPSRCWILCSLSRWEGQHKLKAMQSECLC